MGGCISSKDQVIEANKKPRDDSAFKTHASAEELEEYKCFFKKDTKSLLSQYLTEEIWNEYKDQKCSQGVSFKTCVYSGIANLDSGVGLYAGSADAYSKFNKLFDPVIKHYHGHGLKDKHISDMDAEKLTNADFNEEDSALILSTRVRVARNMADFPLGPGVSKEQRLQIMEYVIAACEKFEDDLKGEFHKLEGMSEDTQNQLIADHVLFKEGDRFLDACNLNRDWPSGRGIYMNELHTFNIWCNEEDQLRIISMDKGADIKGVFSKLQRACQGIEKEAKFAHNEHLGYITSCPTNLGTGLRASVHIKLLKLMENKEKMQAIADKYNVQIRGAHGEHTETNDGIFDISNKRRLGHSERSLVQDMIDGVRALIKAERECA